MQEEIAPDLATQTDPFPAFNAMILGLEGRLLFCLVLVDADVVVLSQLEREICKSMAENMPDILFTCTNTVHLRARVRFGPKPLFGGKPTL